MRKLSACMLSPAVRVVPTLLRPAWFFQVVANNFTIGPTVHSTSAWDGPGLSSYWRNKMDKTFYSLKKETNVRIIPINNPQKPNYIIRAPLLLMYSSDSDIVYEDEQQSHQIRGVGLLMYGLEFNSHIKDCKLYSFSYSWEWEECKIILKNICICKLPKRCRAIPSTPSRKEIQSVERTQLYL